MNLSLQNGIICFVAWFGMSACVSSMHIVSNKNQNDSQFRNPSSSNTMARPNHINPTTDSTSSSGLDSGSASTQAPAAFSGLHEPVALGQTPYWQQNEQNSKTLIGVEFLKFSDPLKLDTGETVNAVYLESSSSGSEALAQYGKIDDRGFFNPTQIFTKWHVKIDIEASILLGEYRKGYIEIDRKGSSRFNDDVVQTNPHRGDFISPGKDFKTVGLRRK